MSQETSILVVTPEPVVRDICRGVLERSGHALDEADSGAHALTLLRTRHYGVLVLDLSLADGSPVDFLRQATQLCPTAVPIVLASYATIRFAVQAIRLGAQCCITKPFAADELREAVAEAVEKGTLLGAAYPAIMVESFHELVGRSRVMIELFQRIAKVAPSHSTVLIAGEHGTGRRSVARAIHALSRRSKGAFVRAPGAGVSPTEIAGRWLGRVRGGRSTPGLFEIASGGSLLLEDVGDLSSDLQLRLLAVLVDRRYSPLGSADVLKFNARVLSLSDRSLPALVSEGRFDEVLYYRLAVCVLQVPPLRERKEDIPLLVRHILGRFCRQARRRPMTVAEEVLKLLGEHGWPGNVRELEAVIESAALAVDGDLLEVRHLRSEVDVELVAAPVPRSAADLKRRLKLLRREAVREVERLFVVRALERAEGNVSRAARDVGMQRPNFQALMRKHHVRLRLPEADEADQAESSGAADGALPQGAIDAANHQRDEAESR